MNKTQIICVINDLPYRYLPKSTKLAKVMKLTKPCKIYTKLAKLAFKQM
jgi:hypothetical protein